MEYPADWTYDPITVKPGEPLYPGAYVSQPASLPGVLSWTIELAQPRGYVKVAVSPNGTQVATGAYDGVVRIWDVQTGKMKAAFVPSPLSSLQDAFEWSPAGRFIAIGSRKCIVVDVENGRSLQLGALNENSEIRWSPDGRFLAWPSGNQVHVWDAVHQRQAASFIGHKSKPLVLTWSPTGEQIASSAEDRTVLVWNVASLQPVQSLALPGTSRPTSIDWSPDGRMLATVVNFQEVCLWNAESGERLATIQELSDGKSDDPIRWSPDGKLLLSARGRVFDIPKWQSHQLTCLLVGSSGAYCAWNPNGDLAFIGYSTGHSYFASSQTNIKSTLTDFHPTFRTLNWADAGRCLVVVLHRQVAPSLACLWDASKGMTISTFVMPDGTTPAINSLNGQVAACGTKLQVWDWSANQFVTEFQLPSRAIVADWSPDGTQLAILHEDKLLRIWTLADGSSVTLAENTEVMKDRASVLRWSPDIANVALAHGGTYEGWIAAWNVQSRAPLMSPTNQMYLPRDVTWSEDGKTVTYTSAAFSRVSPSGIHASPDANTTPGSDSGLIRLTDVASKRTLATATLLPRSSTPCLISGDGHYLCEADVTGQLFYVVQTTDGQQTYSPAEFAAKFGWRNDPTQVTLAQSRPLTP